MPADDSAVSRRDPFAWLTALFAREGSTRSAGLMRIGLGLAAWAETAREIAPFTDHRAVRIAFAAGFFLASAACVLGRYSRVSAAATGALLLVLWHDPGNVLDFDYAGHHHNFLLAIAFLFLALTPCERSFSLDRWIALRRAAGTGGPAPSERAPVWGLTLISLQVSAVYFWTAIDKTQIGFLSGARLQQTVMHFYTGSDLPNLPGFVAMCQLGGVLTPLLEYALAFGMWIPRFRWPLFLAALLFHALIYVSFPVSTFSVVMALLLLSFFPPDEVDAALRRLAP